MKNIIESHFDNWNDLYGYIKSFTHFPSYIFRGHSETDWKLESTLARALNRVYDKSSDNLQSLITQHLNNFSLNIRGKTIYDLSKVEENDLWALGQHFGLYTPLLDFSRSPLVSLFFSCIGECRSEKRCLWILSESRISEINVSQSDQNLIVEKFIPMSHDNQRLLSQQGLFLKLPLNMSLEEHINNHEFKHKGLTCMKITFNESLSDEILMNLQQMNINQLTLFPDLIGSALHTNYLFEMAPKLEEHRKQVWLDYQKNIDKK